MIARMSRRRTKERGRPVERGPTRRRRRPGRFLWLLALVALTLALGWVVWRGRRPGTPAPRGDSAPAADLSPERAYALALDLGQQGRVIESLPYFRRAASAPEASWVVHHDYS